MAQRCILFKLDFVSSVNYGFILRTAANSLVVFVFWRKIWRNNTRRISITGVVVLLHRAAVLHFGAFDALPTMHGLTGSSPIYFVAFIGAPIFVVCTCEYIEERALAWFFSRWGTHTDKYCSLLPPGLPHMGISQSLNNNNKKRKRLFFPMT